MSEERTERRAYGWIDVVCDVCLKANRVSIDVGKEGRAFWPVECEKCGERQTLVVEVKEA